jgi:predicted DNA-binding transcriptional regulator AlpA
VRRESKSTPKVSSKKNWRSKPRKVGVTSPPGYVRERELAEMLGVRRRTVRRWYWLRIGPPRTTIGRQIFYELASVNDWLKSREKKQTSNSRGRA